MFSLFDSGKKKGLVSACDWCLDNQEKYNQKVAAIFNANANKASEDRKTMGYEAVVMITPQVANELSLTADIFTNVRTLLPLFDFDGSYCLELIEVQQMYMSMIKDARINIAGRKENVDVPMTSMNEMGYTIVKELGRGGQGAMYLATAKDEDDIKSGKDKNYCIKFYDKADDNAGGLEDLCDEYSRMKDFKHPNVARTYHAFQDQSFLYLVNEPYFGKDFTHLAQHADEAGVSMSEDWWRQIFKQGLTGIEYLHSRAVIHCDIKEENMMIKDVKDWKKPKVVLIDLGLASTISAGGGFQGTPGYIPPETYAEERWYPRGDIYSMGVTFFELVSGHNDCVLSSADDAQERRMATRMELPWADLPPAFTELRELLQQMTAKDRRTRPRAKVALRHAWFNSSSDAPLPKNIKEFMVKGSRENSLASMVCLDLLENLNLDEIRAVLQEFDSVASGGTVEEDFFRKKLSKAKVDKATAKEYVNSIKSAQGKCMYKKFLEGVVADKEAYSCQFIRECFNDIDADESGFLDHEEIEEMMKSDAFECNYEDVDQIMEDMDTNKDNRISWEEFKKASLIDGRIARRASSSCFNKATGFMGCF